MMYVFTMYSLSNDTPLCSNWQLVYDDKDSQEQAFVCSNDAKGWTPSKSYYCKFNPNTGYPLLPTILLLVFCAGLAMVIHITD